MEWLLGASKLLKCVSFSSLCKPFEPGFDQIGSHSCGFAPVLQCWKLPNDDFDVKDQEETSFAAPPFEKTENAIILKKANLSPPKTCNFLERSTRQTTSEACPTSRCRCRSLAVATASAPERLAEKMVERLQQLSRSLMWRCEEMKTIHMVYIVCTHVYFSIYIYVYDIHTCIRYMYM